NGTGRWETVLRLDTSGWRGCAVTGSPPSRVGASGLDPPQTLSPRPVNGSSCPPIAVIHQSAESCTKPRCEPRSLANQAILIEVMNNKKRPGIFKRHRHIARHRGGSQSELRISKFETATWARKRDVEGFAGELIDLGTGLALQDARYLDPC